MKWGYGMAHYFFDHRDNDELTPDEDGLEFQDLASAQIAAARALAEYSGSMIPGCERRSLAMEVRDENGPVFTTRIVFEGVSMLGEPNQYGRDRSDARH